MALGKLAPLLCMYELFRSHANFMLALVDSTLNQRKRMKMKRTQSNSKILLYWLIFTYKTDYSHHRIEILLFPGILNTITNPNSNEVGMLCKIIIFFVCIKYCILRVRQVYTGCGASPSVCLNRRGRN